MQIITFTIGDKHYAIATDKVDEISKNINSTLVPNAPSWVEGVINLRGNVVTLLNLSKLLHIEDNLCYNIIIINNEDEKVGLMVRDVDQVMEVDLGDIQKFNSEDSDGTLGILKLDGEIINIIDIDVLLSKNEG